MLYRSNRSGCQKAPSAKRCIKTGRVHLGRIHARVRKHRAPKGALRHHQQHGSTHQERQRQKAPSAKRCIKTCVYYFRVGEQLRHVRKHRAPKGALRPGRFGPPGSVSSTVRKHRAPKGALRRGWECGRGFSFGGVRKHRAPKGALRQPEAPEPTLTNDPSESTERQKVH